MKTIYLARHAKSSWNSNATKDFDRPLNKRGEKDAINIAQALITLDWVPQKIIASPAMRAKQTCFSYCEKLNYAVNEVEWDAYIYEAPTSKLLQVLKNLKESDNHVMLIGHNPSMESVLSYLCGYSNVLEHKQADGKIFTTGNVAKITIESTWEELSADQANLERILRPKEI